MADVSLDDLIKQDKDKNKTQRANKNFKNKIIQKQRHNPEPRHHPNHLPPPPNPHFKNRHNNPPNQPRQPRQPRKFHPAENTERQPKFKHNKPRPQPKEEDSEQRDKFFRTLKVMGLSPEFTNQDLYKLFATEGALQKCLIEQDNFGRSLLTAIVKYHDPEHAKSAIQNLNRHKIMNCVLTVQPYKNVKK